MKTIALIIVALAAAFAGLLVFGLRDIDFCTHHESPEDWS